MGKRLILLGLTIVGVADLMSCGRPAGLEGELVLEEGQPGDARGSLVRLYRGRPGARSRQDLYGSSVVGNRDGGGCRPWLFRSLPLATMRGTPLLSPEVSTAFPSRSRPLKARSIFLTHFVFDEGVYLSC